MALHPRAHVSDDEPLALFTSNDLGRVADALPALWKMSFKPRYPQGALREAAMEIQFAYRYCTQRLEPCTN